MSLSTPCEKFHFEAGVRVGIRVSFWVSGRVGVWMSFFCSYLFASHCLPASLALPACLPWVPACLPWVPWVPYLPPGPNLGAGPPCLLASECFNNTRHNTTYNGHSTHNMIGSRRSRMTLESKASQVGGSRTAGARQARGRVGLRVAPIGLEFCGRAK